MNKLSIIIPAFNEIRSISQIIKKVKAVKIPKEIIIIDDGSTDGTREFLEKINDTEIKVFFHDKNRGKSSAIRTGIKHVTGDITIIQDADLEYDPADYKRLIKPIIDGRVKVVYGSRFSTPDKRPGILNPYFAANRVLTHMANILYSSKITDEPTCYKVFDTSVLKSLHLKSKRFEFCPEVTAKVSKAGWKILELPISYYPRTLKEGKKIKFRDGIEAIWTLIKYRFVD
ncbi:MAG: glycosyltransferase family 2 protein [Nanoarchaeota archaeon]